LDFNGWWSIGIDGSPEPEPAGVDASLDVGLLGPGFDRSFFDWQIRFHALFALPGLPLHATGLYTVEEVQNPPL
jgi:hypothetical protein